ncbi:NADPH-dependent FMN reductase [Nocardioides currus]|uniref:NADPH-dependent FMN reductase n=1 Tax=Nocardioides currus TaxID=2133958 RepID=A0A2R7Z2B8_9ACTN|nr:NAD(P)H-dependent oxidoreductase [Nocardioides currus]PUA82386.1 NADPH-dependent FMN reductase [Nocardioides currus]
MTTAVLVGNPKAGSRTLAAATHLADELGGADLVIDLAEHGAELFDFGSSAVARLVEQVQACDLLVVATPTYKATYTGLLKSFLDWFPADSLLGTTAVPLMLGGSPAHALAPEHGLRQVLVELGAAVPTRGLYLLDSAYDDPSAYTGWLDAARPRLTHLAHLPTARQAVS